MSVKFCLKRVGGKHCETACFHLTFCSSARALSGGGPLPLNQLVSRSRLVDIVSEPSGDTVILSAYASRLRKLDGCGLGRINSDLTRHVPAALHPPVFLYTRKRTRSWVHVPDRFGVTSSLPPLEVV